jgi:hypothetical protein
MKTQDLETQDARLEVCDHPKMPHSLRVLEARQGLVDGGIKRAEHGCDGWPVGGIERKDVERGTAMEKHRSVGLCLVRNFEGCDLAAVIDGLLLEMELRTLVEQTVAMLPRWAGACLPGILRSVPESIKREKWELKALQRWGLISGLHYDNYACCLRWECTELLTLVVRELEMASTTMGGTESTEGEAGL